MFPALWLLDDCFILMFVTSWNSLYYQLHSYCFFIIRIIVLSDFPFGFIKYFLNIKIVIWKFIFFLYSMTIWWLFYSCLMFSVCIVVFNIILIWLYQLYDILFQSKLRRDFFKNSVICYVNNVLHLYFLYKLLFFWLLSGSNYILHV